MLVRINLIKGVAYKPHFSPQIGKTLKLTNLMTPYSLTLQTALVLSALAACGQGTMIYDQQSATNRSFSGGSPFQEEQPIGQSFTPALSSVGFVEMEFMTPIPGTG